MINTLILQITTEIYEVMNLETSHTLVCHTGNDIKFMNMYGHNPGLNLGCPYETYHLLLVGLLALVAQPPENI